MGINCLILAFLWETMEECDVMFWILRTVLHTLLVKIHCSKHITDHSLNFGYFHPQKEFSNGQNIMLLSNDLSICTLMFISIEAQDGKQTREKLTYP